MYLHRGNKERCEKILFRYGNRPQLGMVIEECSELIQATSKMLRKGTIVEGCFSENFKEELADVVAMCEQARQMCGMSDDELNRRVAMKLDKVIARFENVSV